MFWNFLFVCCCASMHSFSLKLIIFSLKNWIEAIKIKILTFKLKYYSPIDNYRELNIVCEVGIGKGYFGWGWVDIFCGLARMGGGIFWVVEGKWKYILHEWTFFEGKWGWVVLVEIYFGCLGFGWSFLWMSGGTWGWVEVYFGWLGIGKHF